MNPVNLYTKQLAQDEPLFTPRVVEKRENETMQMAGTQLVKNGILEC